MKTAYLDCIAGASGDMLLGVLVDAGLPFKTLQQTLRNLNIIDFELTCKNVSKNGFAATKISVIASDSAPERKLADLIEVVEDSEFSNSVKEKAIRIFTRICKAEAAIHSADIHEVHLHEVGGVDSIVDVLGVLAGFEIMAFDHICVSPLPMPRGFVYGAHGQIPLPAPATIALLKDIPIYGSTIEKELVTPTGAALLTEIADSWGQMPAMTLEKIAYGAGTRDLSIPNVIRMVTGSGKAIGKWTTETIVELETNIDNQTGETLGHTLQRLMEEGALDAIAIPILMKKGRPAHTLKVIAKPTDADRLEALLFNETATLGIRRKETRRDYLPREIKTVETQYGPIRLKISKLPNGEQTSTPEYEDCRKAAEEHGVSIRKIVKTISGLL